MSSVRQLIFSASLMVVASVSVAGEEPGGVLMKAMRDELARSMESLQMEQMDKPYFLAYRVDEIEGFRTSGYFGALGFSDETKRRALSVELRVGDYDLDNTNFLGNTNAGTFRGYIPLPLEDDYNELRRQLWLATDAAYKRAQGILARKLATLENQVRGDVPDFAASEPIVYHGKSTGAKMTLAQAEALASDLSGIFKDLPGINDSRVDINKNNRRSFFVNSEGTAFTYSQPLVWVQALARTQATDGTVLQDFEVFHERWNDLPDQETMAQRVRAMGTLLLARRDAGVVDRYSGPVLFEGQAAAELFAQVMVPRLIGTRVPLAEDPRMNFRTRSARNPFIDKVGARVLPRFLSVFDDPSINEYGGGSLQGGYPVDDDGIPAEPTALIENGILKTLLTTRNPVDTIRTSTGNRRGAMPVPSNILVSSDSGQSAGDVRNLFLQLVEERGIEFGIVVRHIGNGFLKINYPTDTFGMSRGQSNMENLVRVYKVFPDGSEELIREAVLSDIADSSFKEIVAVSRESMNYTLRLSPGGGASSVFTSALYGIPLSDTIVTLAVPDLLFEEVTLRKPIGNTPSPPVTVHPFFDTALK